MRPAAKAEAANDPLIGLPVRGPELLLREVGASRDAVRIARAERPFSVDAWVVLPDHLHCVWALPEGDSDYSVRWGGIKARFSHGIMPGAKRAGSKIAKSKKGQLAAAALGAPYS